MSRGFMFLLRFFLLSEDFTDEEHNLLDGVNSRTSDPLRTQFAGVSDVVL